ncbi:MAG: M36 family metallopeptidase [Verrucomicrobia bacterium]|nr:M36 family metallopeptidase [Verrucomicrobiota bacterium]
MSQRHPKPTPRLNRRRLLAAALGLLALNTFAAPPAAPPPNFDHRPPAAITQTVDAPGLNVSRHPVTGAPRLVKAVHGFLTSADVPGKNISAKSLAAGVADPHHALKNFLNEHTALYGHGAEVLEAAAVTRDFTAAHSGLRTTVWQQQAAGLDIFEAVLVAHVTQRGELVSVASQFVPASAAAAMAAALPALTAPQAISRAAKNLGENLSENTITATASASGAEQKQIFTAPALRGEVSARLVWLPLSATQLALCWEVTLTSRAQNAAFRLLVDAQTGAVIVRHCLTESISAATYNVFTSDSPSPFSPGWPVPDSTQPPTIARTPVTLPALDTNASPAGWIPDGGNETLGNNVDAHTDRDANDVADLPRPQGSPARTFDFPLDLDSDPTNSSAAAVVQLFYWCNFMHDKLYELGFTEAAGNFQSDNFARGGAGGDAVQADAQDGSGFNNANMTTYGDGTPPRMQMYLFNGPSPHRDGDLDAEIILHEYTHGLSNRRVGGGVGISALQTDGMGEGWSDFYALSLLSEPGDDPNAVYTEGGYATLLFYGLTQNYYFGIRRYPYSTDLAKNPLTFRDIDPAQANAHSGVPISPVFPFSAANADEVHNQGEVWCITLWEARARLIAKYGGTNGNWLMLPGGTLGRVRQARHGRQRHVACEQHHHRRGRGVRCAG